MKNLKLTAAVFIVAALTALTGCVSAQNSAVSSSEETSADGYVSPIDFDELKAENEDIYAWITVPGTQVDYPVLRNEDDQDYYLRRGIDGAYKFAGSLYTQSEHNGDDFSDRVTIIYGHNMTDGTMFGELQKKYSDEEYFKEDNTFTIYTPEKTLHYEIIAVSPYSDYHIMWLYQEFTEDSEVLEFLKELKETEDDEAHFAEGYEPDGSENLVILETCNNHDKNNRYIVVGMLTDTEE